MNIDQYLPQNWGVRGLAIAAILIAALVSFEVFNFDTTKFALSNLLGDVTFLGIQWAAILAFAFCGIDFAGLLRMFTPEQGLDEPKEVWLLMGAWLIGATMNAVMTWYAVSLIIETRSVGTKTVSQEDMWFFAPIFVAFLVWLTRILFIGSLATAGDRFLHGRGQTTRHNKRRHLPRHAPLRDQTYRHTYNNNSPSPVNESFDDEL